MCIFWKNMEILKIIWIGRFIRLIMNVDFRFIINLLKFILAFLCFIKALPYEDPSRSLDFV
jgi:hypothetical protein